MGALIGGSTIYRFGEIPIGDEQASAKNNKSSDKLDVSTMFMKYENMRVLIVDEGSSAPCESPSTLELNIRIATRDVAETYKVRHGKKNQRTK